MRKPYHRRYPRALGWAWVAALAACRDGGAPRTAESATSGGTPPPGFWFDARVRADVDLGGLGYAPGTRAEEPEAAPGSTTFDSQRRAPGVDLYCSGHAPEATLLDADGRMLHRWAFDPASSPEVPPLAHPTQRAWRRVRLADDGGLFALHEGLALLRLDAESRLRWCVAEGAHHDLDIDARGDVHVLVRRAVEVPAIAGGQTVVDDGVAILAPDGSLRRRVSLLEALAASPWAYALEAAASAPEGRMLQGEVAARDLLHTNSYALLAAVPPGLPPAFAPGRALVCFRELDALAVFDVERGALVWFLQGSFDGPHDPELAADGTLWVFDNGLRRGTSRVVALDPHTGRELRAWPPSPHAGFHSEVCGAVQPLPNGNLLLTESTRGRAVEVAPDGAIVWRFVSPHRVAGPDGPLVACLFEVERLPHEAASRWR